MEAVYTLEATVTNDGIHTRVEIKSGGATVRSKQGNFAF